MEGPATRRNPKHFWNRITATDITAFSTLILAIGSLGTLLFAWIQIQNMREGVQHQISEMRDEARGQIREMREEAKTQHLISLINAYNSPENQLLRKSLAQKRVEQKRLRELDTDNIPVELDDELAFCDNMGLLTERGYLDRHDVWYVFGQWLFFLREDARPYLDSLKSNPADYQMCSHGLAAHQ